MRHLLFILPILISSHTVAQTETQTNWEIGVAVGYGKRNNPLVQADDIETVVNLDIAWYGERFFFDNGDVGYNLLAGEDNSLNLIAQINNERAYFSKTNTQFISIGGGGSVPTGNSDQVIGEPGGELQNPPEVVEQSLPDRSYAIEAGLEYTASIFNGDIYLSAVSDISNTHQGYRLSAAYSKPLLYKRWFANPSIGAQWQSRSLNDYYYGVTADEATATLPFHTAEAGLNTYASVLFGYALRENMFWSTRIAYEQFDSSLLDSPLLKQDYVSTVFSGIKYTF